MVPYTSTCVDITSTHTPDPWVCNANGKFYLTFTGNDRIPMWDASSLMDFYGRPSMGPVWRAPQTGPQSERLWAPELHSLRGRWYIYFAGSDKTIGNRSHRMYVLGGPPADEDPHAEGQWELLGPIAGMDQRQWAIDGTVFEIHARLYFAYSGWPRRGDSDSGWEERDERVQQLFIMELSDPITAASDSFMISHPSNDWERLGDIGINEGPQWLSAPNGYWRGLVFSCAPSWTKHYKMATLQFLGGDPLNPRHWLKGSKPLLQNREDGLGPYGPGHGCFLQVGWETLAIFHATDRETDGSQNRRCRMQRLGWGLCGPHMGNYVGANAREVAVGASPYGCREEEDSVLSDQRSESTIDNLMNALRDAGVQE